MKFSLLKYYKKIKLFIIKVYNYTSLCFKKYKTIKNMYKPLVDSKIHEKNQLTKEISILKQIDSNLNKEIEVTKKQNLTLQNNIDTLLDILISNNK